MTEFCLAKDRIEKRSSQSNVVGDDAPSLTYPFFSQMMMIRVELNFDFLVQKTKTDQTWLRENGS